MEFGTAGVPVDTAVSFFVALLCHSVVLAFESDCGDRVGGMTVLCRFGELDLLRVMQGEHIDYLDLLLVGRRAVVVWK